MRETSLAWALAEAAKPHLNAVERSDVHVAIGVGDTFGAIRFLITSAADRRIALPAEVILGCHGWLDVYVGHEDERHLSGLVEQVLTPYAIRSQQGSTVNGEPTSNRRTVVGEERPVRGQTAGDGTRWPGCDLSVARCLAYGCSPSGGA